MKYIIEDFLFRISVWQHIVANYTEELFKAFKGEK